jgi:hypothetical protein
VRDIEELLREGILFNRALSGRNGCLVQRDVKGPLAVIGDLHGEVKSLETITEKIWDMAHPVPPRGINFIFLGDYVDRGPNSLGVLEKVISLALETPERTVLLRGNHEDWRMNSYYGFSSELKKECPDLPVDLLLEWYESLPLVCVVSPFLMVHGGPPFPVPHSLEELASMQYSTTLGMHMLWSDPDDDFYVNRGGGTRSFSERECREFLDLTGCSFLIRGHQYVPGGGFKVNFGNCVTLFSASYGNNCPRSFLYANVPVEIDEIEKHIHVA